LADPGCTGAADDDETEPPPPSPDPQVGLAQPDGGPSYYSRFTNPLSTSPDYFPIGVWGAYNQTAANRKLDADVGINLPHSPSRLSVTRRRSWRARTGPSP
jgi:hypothetical protein